MKAALPVDHFLSLLSYLEEVSSLENDIDSPSVIRRVPDYCAWRNDSKQMLETCNLFVCKWGLKGIAFGVENTGSGFEKSIAFSEADIQMSLS